MGKITKRHYNRKLMFFGGSLFASVALISTGFAAFVISTNAESQKEGNINVGTITTANMEFQNINFKDLNDDGTVEDSFIFEPTNADTTGRVTFDGDNSESLKVTISGTVTNQSYLGKITYQLYVPESVVAAAPAEHTEETPQYIKLPVCFSAPQEISKDNMTIDYENDTASFEFSVEFDWGEVFGGMNPSEFYDSSSGQNVSDAAIEQTLKEFRKTMYGLTNDDDNIPEGNDQFRIEITAHVK